ncbi:hypothetical protein [uncultured Rubinisphaera sp.]|uniref:tetratricopeptide repeat protein n=2 Tax=Rubinisphaera TaxID=1649490 RepID=UPI0026C14D32|tara:strand:+ start:15803 stop:18241 length:2439 start_codon:yes stop_codon:yes gene_type:complete
MELRMCPSCQQSVLDDDVKECPFCGAAMDGSSGPTTPAKPAARKKEASADQPQAPAKAAEPVQQKEEDPFAVKPKAPRKVIKLQRKPTAKVNHRVVCPMCDTNGFGTEAVAGKEVKCPNPKCLMPIFTAPELEVVEPEEPKKPLVTPVRIFSLVAVLVMAGIGIFFYVNLPPAPTPEPVPGPIVNDGNDNIDQVDPKKNDPVIPDGPPAKPPVDIAALEQTIFQSSIDSALQRSDNRSKPYCRQLNAEAYIANGDLANALKQLEAFDALESGLNYFKITPLSIIGWSHLKKGDTAAANKSADEALSFSSKLPKTGAEAVRHAVALGSLLVALERYEDARALLETREDVQDVAQSAARIAIVIEDGTFALDESYNWLPKVRWTSPLSFATAYSAAIRGYSTQTAEFVKALQDPMRKSECLAAYAAAQANLAVRSGAAFQMDALPAIEGITPEDQNRALAQALQSLKKDATSEKLSNQVATAMESWQIPEAAVIPEFLSIYNGDYQFGTISHRAAAHAHLLLARFYSQAGEKAKAWEHVEKSLKYTATIGPSKATADALVKDVDQNRASIQSRLASELNIEGDIRQRTAFNRYRTNATSIAKEAQNRIDLESQIYDVTLDWGLSDQYFQAFKTDLQTPRTDNFRTILENNLSTDVLYSLRQSSNDAAVKEYLDAWPSAATGKSRLESRLEINRLVDAGNIPQVRLLMKRIDLSLHDPLIELRYACQIAEQQNSEVTLDWIAGMNSIVDQEVAYRFSSVKMTRRGEIESFWDASKKRNLSATDKCSRNLGLIEGLNSTDVYLQETEEPQPGKKKP